VPKKATAPKKPETTKKDEPVEETTLEKVIKDFDAAWDYCKGDWHDRWSNNYKLYNNTRVKRGYFGISDTFVPMTFSTVETLTSALFGAKPKFNYLPPRNKKDQKTDVLNGALDFFWDKDQWSIKVINTGRGMLMRGTGVDYFYWCGDHPVMLNVPLRDFFIDPTASSIETARYMGRRYLTTIDELKSFEVVDLDADADKDGNHPMKKKYKIPDNWAEADDTRSMAQSSTDKPTDKQEKDMFYGSTLSADSVDQVEVIEYWTNDNVYSVLNRNIIIEDEENYFKAKAKANGDEYAEGIMPFAAARDYVDESLFYAKGEVDFIADMQEDLNDSSNQNKDAISYVVNPMYTLDPKYGDQIETVENLPGAVYPFEANTLVPIQQRPIPPDAFNERMNIKAEIRETTASNEVVKGASQTGGKTTATEINAQIAGSGQRINLKITQIENEYFHRIARIIFHMMRLYITEPMMIRIVGKDGARWEEYKPDEYKDGEYEPRVQLDISIENQKADDAANAKEMMAAFLNDPDVNQVELKKLVLAKGFSLDPDEVEVLLQPNPVPPQDPSMMGAPPMGADPMAGGMMPPDAMAGAGMPPMSPMDPMAGAPLPPPAAMPPQLPPEQPAPEIITDPQTGAQYVIDPVSGQLIPLEAPMAA
jgi:hypothetical protein